MEIPVSSPQHSGKRGGWITFPFMIATIAGLTLASAGWVTNLIPYLIEEFHMKSISAAKIYNYVNGSILVLPIVAGVIADSFFGCFGVIWFSSLVSFLGTVLLVLTAAADRLRPPKCENGSNVCKYPSGVQSAVLYISLAMGCLGTAGTRFTVAPMAANQFDEPKHQAIFFDWFIFTLQMTTVISSTAIVYVEDDVSWALGFGICATANMLGLAIFLSGRRFYRLTKPQESPFKNLARVIVAATHKRKVFLSSRSEDYYHEQTTKTLDSTPTDFFKFMNRGALIIEGDTNSDGTITNPWKLCTVQQVEDLKRLIKIFPLWSTGIFLSTPLAIQMGLAIIQARTMDRHLTPSFEIPAATVHIFIFISTCITIFCLDRLLPLWRKFTPWSFTPLRRVGIGHVLNILSMALSAVLESKRLKMVQKGNQAAATVPMSVFWLVPPLATAGIAEAFHFSGNISLYYQEFPESMKSTSTAAGALYIGSAFYLSNAIIDLIQRVTGWWPDNINDGRLDHVFWVCCIMSALNFSYYLLCSLLYRYQHRESAAGDSDSKMIAH